ncbi:MAG: 50S ribosomal protein L19e [Candidatus Aenigmarchaeota archaeon]|nr:50S ribosomal protein L19e [Candidatus Aenigmarchaeota archaeon]
MATRILKCGMSRVWIDPARNKDAEEAITAADIRKLCETGVIKARKEKGNSSGRKHDAAAQRRKGRRKGPGSRKGKATASVPRKEAWMRTIRALRSKLREIRPRMERKDFRLVYRKAGSGFFRSRAHMMVFIERNKMIKNDEKKA